MESVVCPSCRRKFEDLTLLSIHQEYEKCDNSNSDTSANVYLSCPICDEIFQDPLVLQIHVNEVHEDDSINKTKTTKSDRLERMHTTYIDNQQASKAPYEDDLQEDEDAVIARMLQDEEEAQSFEQFQNRYGASTKTFRERARSNLEKIFDKNFITRKQYEEYKNKLDEMIAQPVERMESRSAGLISIISQLPMGNVVDRRLCQSGCVHVSSTWLDQGWSCGYKNFQMLFSSLRHDPLYSAHLFGYEATNQTNQDIPSVSHLQGLIERSWQEGFDSEGRQQLNGRLTNSTKWIGPTELIACLAYLNIKTELYEFHRPTSLDKSVAYEYLFHWIRDYFLQQARTKSIIHPLYLQHEGHSRTIIGYEQFRNGHMRLLIFDPSTPKHEINQFIQNPNAKAHLFRRSLQSFQKPVYQILVVRGLLESNQKEAAKLIRTIKVPLPKP